MRVFVTFSAAILMAGSFFASADTAMNLRGNVVASPCTVDTDTVNKLVEFDPLQRTDLQTAGASGAWQNFSLLVKNCPAGTRQVTVKYLGTNDIQDATAWKNTGTASNVALRMTNADHSVVYSNGSAQQISVNTSTSSAEFPLSAKIFTPQGNAGAGTFAATISLEFTWQ
jgi:minor fimbrial subunit